MCIAYEAEMDSQRLKQELRKAAEVQTKKLKDQKQEKQRQEQKVQTVSTPEMEVRQSPVTGAQVRFVTDPLTRKVDKSVDCTTWPYAPQGVQEGSSMDSNTPSKQRVQEQEERNKLLQKAVQAAQVTDPKGL